MKKSKKIRVICLGGSLVNPGKIDLRFLKKFKDLILSFEDFYFLIVAGGGKVAREYQLALKKFGIKKEEFLDEIGILATFLNAQFLKFIFWPYCKEKILKRLDQKIDFGKKRIIIGGGTKPGWSTDFDALFWAKKLKTKRVIVATNVDYVYDKAPNKKGAKALEKIKWEDYFKICPKKWTPGQKLPLDPIAAKFGKKNKMEIFILNGKNFPEFKKAILGKNFKGSVIF